MKSTEGSKVKAAIRELRPPRAPSARSTRFLASINVSPLPPALPDDETAETAKRNQWTSSSLLLLPRPTTSHTGVGKAKLFVMPARVTAQPKALLPPPLFPHTSGPLLLHDGGPMAQRGKSPPKPSKSLTHLTQSVLRIQSALKFKGKTADPTMPGEPGRVVPAKKYATLNPQPLTQEEELELRRLHKQTLGRGTPMDGKQKEQGGEDRDDLISLEEQPHEFVAHENTNGLITGDVVFRTIKLRLSKLNNLVSNMQSQQDWGLLVGSSGAGEGKVDHAYIASLKEAITVLMNDLTMQNQNIKKLDMEEAQKVTTIRELREEIQTLSTELKALNEEAEGLREENELLLISNRSLESELQEIYRLNEKEESERKPSTVAGSLDQGKLSPRDGDVRQLKSPTKAAPPVEPVTKKNEGKSLATNQRLNTKPLPAPQKGGTISLSTNEPKLTASRFETGKQKTSEKAESANISHSLSHSRGGDKDESESSKKRSKGPPEGIVGIILLDIPGHSRLIDEIPEEMELAMMTFNKVLQTLCQKFELHKVRQCGPKVFFVAHEPFQACLFSMELHDMLVRQRWPQAIHDHAENPTIVGDDDGYKHGDDMHAEWALWRGLRVRVAVHLGECESAIDPCTGVMTYYGFNIAKAVRALELGFGGMTVITKEVYEMLSAIGDEALDDPIITAHSEMLPSGEKVMRFLPKQFKGRAPDLDAKLCEKDDIRLREMQKRRLFEEENDTGDNELEKALGYRKIEVEKKVETVTQDPAMRVPQGILYFVIVQIGKYREIKAALRAVECDDLLYRFHGVVQDHASRNCGIMVEKEVDKALCVFTKASNAITFTMNFQRELQELDALPMSLFQVPGLETQTWRKKECFSGLRVKGGIHQVVASPQFEPFMRQPVYVGEGVLIPAALAEMAHGGLILISDVVYRNALQEFARERTSVHMLPVIQCIGPKTVSTAPGSMVLYQCVPADRIGRLFLTHGFADSAKSRRSHPYKVMCAKLLEELSERRENATAVCPLDNFEDPYELVHDAIRRKNQNKSYLQTVLKGLTKRVGLNPSIQKEIEVLETSMMMLEDPTMYGVGRPMPQPSIGMQNWENIFQQYNDDNRNNMFSAPDVENFEEDDEENNKEEEEAEDELDSPINKVKFTAESGRRDSTTRRRDSTTGSPASPMARRRFSQIVSLAQQDEEVKHLKKKCAILEKEISGLHKEVRAFMALMKMYLDPFTDTHHVTITEEEVITKTVQWHRTVREEVVGKGKDRDQKRLEEWRSIMMASLAKPSAEEDYQDKPQKLCRSIFGHCCKMFHMIHRTLKKVIMDAKKKDKENKVNNI